MSKLAPCPACGNSTSERAAQCPGCGEPLAAGWADKARKKQRSEKATKGFQTACGIVIVLVVIGWLMDDDEPLKKADPAAFAKQVAQIETKLANTADNDFKEQIQLYRELKKLDPENASYASQIARLEQQENAEERRKGFHCLSAWDGSHSAFVDYVEQRMRDPDSFEHIETRITPMNEQGRHTLAMTYRAKNGFGGMNQGTAMALIENADCGFTPVAIE